MSECTRPIDALLVAELDELRGDADTDLGRHVRACPRCSAAAREIVAANGRLDRTFGAEAVIDASALIARARSGPPRTGRLFDRPRRWIAHPIPMRAAAVSAAFAVLAVAVLILVGGREERLPGVEWIPERPRQPPVVDAPYDKVVVIPTANPKLTIIWFSKEDDDAKHVDVPRDNPAVIGPGDQL